MAAGRAGRTLFPQSLSPRVSRAAISAEISSSASFDALYRAVSRDLFLGVPWVPPL